MKKVLALAAITAISSSAFAQLNPVPYSSNLDGVFVQPIGNNAGALYWGNPAGLQAYQFASNDNLNTPKPGTPDNKLGLNWGVAPTGHVASIMNHINLNGGSIRAIFLGESAGWLNDFGYTTTGNPADVVTTPGLEWTSGSFSLWNDIQAVAPGSGIAFGQYADISLAIGQASQFDFWINGANSFSTVNGPVASPGGYYTAFDPSRGNPAVANVRWTQSALTVRNYVDGTLANDQWAATYLVGFEDVRPHAADGDHNDFMFAVQFFDSNGRPFSPVPEPSTYGLIGAVALLGLVARRRFSKK
jgi:hypothetical protein